LTLPHINAYSRTWGGIEVDPSLEYNSLRILFLLLQFNPMNYLLNLNTIHSGYRDISKRTQRGLREGSIRFTYLNPISTLSQPYLNPNWTPSIPWTNTDWIQWVRFWKRAATSCRFPSIRKIQIRFPPVKQMAGMSCFWVKMKIERIV